MFLIGEIYGWNGRPNEGTKESIASIITKIQQYKLAKGWRFRDAVSQKWVDLFKRGYADNAIGAEENEHCIAEEFRQPVIINGEKTPGISLGASQQAAWISARQLRDHARAAHRMLASSGVETAGSSRLVRCQGKCAQFVRTVPVLPRSKKNIDEIDTTPKTISMTRASMA